MQSDAKYFFERLEEALRDAKLSKTDLASLIDIAPSTVSRWRTSIPHPSTLEDICEAIGINAKWLRQGEGPKRAVRPDNTPRGNLKAARIRKGIEPADLARRVGYSLWVYNNIENGLSGMSRKQAEKLARELDMPLSDLLDGSDSPTTSGNILGTFGENPNIALVGPGMEKSRGKYVPLLSMAHMGAMMAYDDSAYSHDGFFVVDSEDPQAFAVRLAGDSMLPLYHPGDVAVVYPNAKVQNNDLVIARLKDDLGGDVMLKVFQQAAGTVTLISYNSIYQPLTFPADSFQWIYAVASVTRVLKKSRVNS